MIGRVLCWFGLHDWGYIYSRRSARTLNVVFGHEYRCVRCGIEP
jgi:hypothetical protein